MSPTTTKSDIPKVGICEFCETKTTALTYYDHVLRMEVCTACGIDLASGENALLSTVAHMGKYMAGYRPPTRAEIDGFNNRGTSECAI